MQSEKELVGHYFVYLNVSCLIFWLAILEKCMETGQWPPVISLALRVQGSIVITIEKRSDILENR